MGATRIEGEMELDKTTISFYSEDNDLTHIKYRITEVKRHYPPPETITRYVTSLILGNGNQDIIDMHLDNLDDLNNILECLMELKAKWEIAENALKVKP